MADGSSTATRRVAPSASPADDEARCEQADSRGARALARRGADRPAAVCARSAWHLRPSASRSLAAISAPRALPRRSGIVVPSFQVPFARAPVAVFVVVCLFAGDHHGSRLSQRGASG
jgi:hypothetical protein